MNFRFPRLAIAMAYALAAVGCSSSGSTPAGTGGTSGGTGGAGGSCQTATACGGDVVGTWTVTSSCLTVGGQLDPSSFGANCPRTTVTGSHHVTGTWTANPNGTVSDDTTTTGTEQFSLASSCLVISSTPTTCAKIGGLVKILGYDAVTCTDASDGGCDCSATVNQRGGLGLVSPDPTTSGNQATQGNTLTITGGAGDATYAYCVGGSQLIVTPQGDGPTLAGTITLEKSAGAGTGGTTGTGGGSGSGGMTGSGGQAGTTGSGGSGGSGAGVGSGGTAGGGGRAGSGGAAGGGGRVGSGGSGGAGTGGGAGAGTGGSGSAGTSGNMGPCDIYESGGNTCVAAHSTIRALSAAYGGKLYQLRNSGGTTKDISAVAPGGVADVAAQTSFCSGTTC